MRKIGIPEIEDIALGAALLGAGGGGDPYVGKLVAIGAVQECGPITLLDPDEVPDDALVVPIAMMGAPTVLCEKAIGGEEYRALYETVSAFYGKPIYAFMPIEAGGVNSMLPIAAAARLGLPLVDCDGMGRAFPELQMVTFTIGGGSATPMALVDEKGNSCIFRTVTNKWTEELARAVTMACGGSVSVSLYAMDGHFMKQYGVHGIVTRSQRLGEAIRTVKTAADPEAFFLEFTGGYKLFKGKIADVLAKAEDDETPLQKKLASLSKILSFLVLGICVFIFAFKLIKEGDFHAEVVLESFIVAVSLAVAAIPEGLATVVTIVLSMGVTKMSKKNAVIRKLTAVETLGCTQIICSDKTGTLTQNKMTVVEHYGDDETLLARGMAQCSDAVLDENKQAKGEPTECALVNYAYKLGLDKGEMSKKEVRVAEAPFDSMRKMMSTVHKQGERIVQYTKGAPDEILKRCTAFWSGGREQPMTERKREEILARNKGMADRALRVLALAYRRLEEAPKDCEPASLEHDLVFVGLTGMIDPVRPEVKAAILECRSAGIRPIMITGDHIDTAAAIAKELGIISDASEATTGAAIGAMNDKEFAEKIEKYSVYARVQPEHKVRIVNGWRAKGKITAMTGDGVNDAPSIKSADIGVGMGIAGTDVTKNAADMVLADDNFATIVAAVGEGRRIYDNIRKAIQFLLSSNLSEVVAVFVATLFGFTLLRPMHLLWINLITDTFPALALGMEQGEDDLMRRAPRDSKEGIFAHGMGADIFLHGFYIAIITLLSYFLGHYIETGVWDWSIESADGMTMAFLTMSMMEIFHAFNVRLQRKSIFSTRRQNVWLWGAMAISLLLTAAVIYIPFLKNAFEFEAISAAEYAIAMALALSVIPFVELSKAIRRILEK